MGSFKSIESREASESPCFVAGTPVHTATGVVPIQDLKIGDLVLSAMDGSDAPEYRRIAKVDSLNDQEVTLIRVGGLLESREETFEFDLVVTDTHRFWVKELGWLEAFRLEEGSQLLRTDGGDAWVSIAEVVVETGEPHIGWTTRDSDTQGPTIDLRDDQISVTRDFDEYTFNPEALRNWVRMKRTVHRIEVEGRHSFFAGDVGVLVEG